VKLPWDSRLDIGVELIDRQHRELFHRLGDLLVALLANRGRSESEKVLAFLGTYVVEHFSAEERLMAAHGYPEATAHRRQHADFVKAFGVLRVELEKGGPSVALAVRANRVIASWLREHIGTADRALGEFLGANGPAGAA